MSQETMDRILNVLDKLAKADEVNFALIAELASAVIIALGDSSEAQRIEALESLRHRLAMASVTMRGVPDDL